ncbi:MAG: glycosyl hydrolase [Thermoanaerobaculia bacterium]|nr:glycosyl hydrolase [Thermoanaerobaculia bacterium]
MTRNAARRPSPLALWAVAAALLGTAATATAAGDEPAAPVDEKLLAALELRNIGPYRGGRSTAVTGVRQDPLTFYMGSTGGGVWKTEDGGASWANVSDGHLGAASIGAVAVAPSDPNVVWAGTGSACPRGNVSPGDGIYRSTDGGDSWSHAGLPEAGQIGAIAIHPDDPDRVWVAALGHIFGPNEERGVYRTRDAGATWERVLFVSETAGAVDLAMDPTNPRILFAAIWETERKPWTLTSGGEQSGLYRTRDGGDTWEKVNDGLPEGVVGRIGVSVSAARPDRVYALVEAEEGGLFRSDDGGEKFRRINPDRNFRQRAWYYTHVFADPVDPETVYVLNTSLWRSPDAGQSFRPIRAPHGDHHALWIHPDDPSVLINGNDGGANVSYNGGRSWSTQANQPTAEMYRVTVDGQFPYRVYGCQQDNSCVSLPSRTAAGSIARHHWYVIGGCESGHVAVDPRDPQVTYSGCYGGSIERYDHGTGDTREIMTYPQLAIGVAPSDLEYRFQWNAPIRLSPHDPSVLYHTSQYVHRSTDEGQSWEIISPDLTRDDPEKLDYAGGPITRDNTGVEVYCTIFAFEESPHTAGLLWAGTDDGRVHLSHDAGGTWEEITPPGMPEWGQVNSIELSPHGPGRAFLAVTRYKFDDFTPWIFRTDDYGATWTRIGHSGEHAIPDGHFVRVVREAPGRRGLLFAGTEFGLYLSLDDGRRWQRVENGMPVTPVTDLAFSGSDLVVATQGRSFWILDDLTPIEQLDAEARSAAMHLFTPRPAHRLRGGGFFGGGGGGQNPPNGVVLYYLLAEKPEGELVLEILDDEGEVLRTLSSEKAEPRAPSPWRRFFPDTAGAGKLPVEPGLNRWVWDLRLKDADIVDDAVLWGLARGPRVPPGTYGARLRLGETEQTVQLEVRPDPRLDTTAAELEAQYDLGREIWRDLSQSHEAVRRLRDVREQIEAVAGRLEKAGLGEDLKEAAEAAGQRLTAIEESIYQTRNEASQDVLNFPPRLDNQLLALLGVVDGAEDRPTAGAERRHADLHRELDQVLEELESALASEVAEFNRLAAERTPVPVIVPPRETR